MTSEPPPPSARRAWLIYTALRVVVFLGATGALILFGLNGFPLLIVALLMSSILSVFLLGPQRRAAVDAALARREQRSAERAATRARLDDA